MGQKNPTSQNGDFALDFDTSTEGAGCVGSQILMVSMEGDKRNALIEIIDEEDEEEEPPPPHMAANRKKHRR